MKKKKVSESLTKNYGVLYETPDDKLVHVYKAVYTLEEAVNVIKNDKKFKKINKSKILIAQLYD